MLANLVCVALDVELQKVASREGLTYTRYADDMIFSGEIADRATAAQLAGEIVAIVGKHGFGINSQKTSIAKNGGRKIVTGLSVEGDVVRLPRSYKDEIRQELYFLEKYGLSDHCARIGHKNHMSYLLRLVGRIRYVLSVEPIIGKRMRSKFQQLFPHFNKIENIILARI
jgi:RNA-directed DNA polymerase